MRGNSNEDELETNDEILEGFYEYYPQMFQVQEEIFCQKEYYPPHVFYYEYDCVFHQVARINFYKNFVEGDSHSIMPFCRSFNEYKNTLLQSYDNCKNELNSNEIRYLKKTLKKMVVPQCLSTEILLKKHTNSIMKNPTFLEPDRNGCTSFKLSCMFLVDGSSSMTKGNKFRDLIEFTRKVVSKFDLSQNDFGVMQYSHFYNDKALSNQRYFVTDIPLGHYKDHVGFNSALDRIKLHGFTTYTAHAMTKARTVDFKHVDDVCLKKVIVVITDGKASDEEHLSDEADLAIGEGFTMIAVGTNGAKKPELKKIVYGTTKPSEERVYYTRKFRNLKNFIKNVNKDLMNLLKSES